MNDPRDYIPDSQTDPDDIWTEEDQDAYDDYLQSKEDLAMEED